MSRLEWKENEHSQLRDERKTSKLVLRILKPMWRRGLFYFYQDKIDPQMGVAVQLSKSTGQKTTHNRWQNGTDNTMLFQNQ